MVTKRYQVTIERRATKALQRFPKRIQLRVDAIIEGLATNPRPEGCKKLRSGIWRVWVTRGWRLYYDIDDKARTVRVLDASTKEAAD